MEYRAPLSAPARRTRRFLLSILALFGVATAAFVVLWSPAVTDRSSSSAEVGESIATQPTLDAPGRPTLARGEADLVAPQGAEVERSTRTKNAMGEADGVIPQGATVSVFDNGIPAVAKLDPSLRDALRRAARDAAANGVGLRVTSGWRSPTYQEELFQDAAIKYGSQKAAARWVATPQTSAHVSGEAVDIGPSDAESWLSSHGAAYGLCQIYRNEPWHYERRPDAVAEGCPPTYADPTEDPRMQP